MNDLASELLSLVFLHLPYTSLLKVQRVCKQWKTIVDEDTALQVQLFKKESKVYVDAGGGQTASWPLKHTIALRSQPVRIHPSAQMVCYSMPMKIERIQISPKAKPAWEEKKHWPHLVDLSIANDLLAIPSVTTVYVKSDLTDPDSDGIRISNRKGVRVADVFRATAKEAQKPVNCGFGNKKVVMTRGELMAECSNDIFEGFYGIYRDEATLYLEMALTG